MTAEAAAKIIKRGLARDDAIIAFPTIMYLFVHTLSTLPATVSADCAIGRPTFTSLTPP